MDANSVEILVGLVHVVDRMVNMQIALWIATTVSSLLTLAFAAIVVRLTRVMVKQSTIISELTTTLATMSSNSAIRKLVDGEE